MWRCSPFCSFNVEDIRRLHGRFWQFSLMELSTFASFKPNLSQLSEGINFEAIGREFQSFLEFCQKEVDNNAAAEVLSSAQLIIDLTWEKLHTGYWKDVDINWRFLYRVASVYRAWGHLMKSCQAESLKSLKCVDMGLLMGAAPTSNDGTTRFAAFIHSQLNVTCPPPVVSSSDSLPPKKRRKIDFPTSDGLMPSGSVPVRNCPDIHEFDVEFYQTQQPVVISGSIDDWPAVQKWNVDYIRRVAQFRSVPIEIGSKYTDAEWGQKIMTIGNFIDQYLLGEPDQLGYLAQHQLFDQIPELGDDLLTPDYTVVSPEGSDDVDVNGWFGPAGTVSPLHTDPRDNLLTQIFGRKFVRLYAPDATVYPNEGSLMANTSLVDVEHPDLTSSPDFASAKPFDVVLEAGQILYIPKLWWHFVKALDPSMSVSYWF